MTNLHKFEYNKRKTYKIFVQYIVAKLSIKFEGEILMKISDRAKLIQPSLTRKLFNMAKEYDDVIDLTLGDPDLAPPVEVCDAAYEAMKSNKMHYSANAGLLDTRNAISDRVYDVWGVKCNPTENLIVTVGGMEALYLTMLSMVNPGDEVIVFAPYYVNYIQMIELCGGTPIIINSYDTEKGIVIDKQILENAVTDKTVAIIINSPNNPTGDIICKDMLEIIADTAEKHDLAIISDEVYRTLIYDGIQHESILQFENAKERTILIDSLSKEYSMTGWRIGYAYGPEEIISNMVKLQENVAACTTVSSQYALIEAYTNQLPNNYIRDEFQKRRNFLFKELSEIDKLIPTNPKGTFYMFIDISKTGMKSEQFAYDLLEKAHIAVVPGVAYGEMYDDYIRIAFTKKIDILKDAVKRLKETL